MGYWYNDKISNFVEGIRLETSQAGRGSPHGRVTPRSSTDRNDFQEASTSKGGLTPKERTDNFIIKAEQFKATVEPPPKGKFCHEVYDDDDYFHLCCHVDMGLKAKIEKGEFVKLERLLPKQRSGFRQEESLEWISKDGMTYLAPIQDKEKIMGIRRWDQAFRMYASIFCAANPDRSGEIWQYIHVINSAVASFQWDNVAYYDFVFRKMMNDRPNRSWVKAYVQLWQLSMRDPINKNQGSGGVSTYGGSNSGNNNHTNFIRAKNRVGVSSNTLLGMTIAAGVSTGAESVPMQDVSLTIAAPLVVFGTHMGLSPARKERWRGLLLRNSN